MKTLLTLLLAAGIAWGQLPIELMAGKRGLTRSGLAAGVNVTGGVDTQSLASIPPGTATLVRGANTGASTDDPTVSLAGWTFDSGDRVSGLPAKGAAWTTTNCSGVECYTVTSAGTEYVNGEARRNLLRWSEDMTNAATGGLVGATLAGSRLTRSATVSAAAAILQTLSTYAAGTVLTLSARATAGSAGAHLVLRLIDISDGTPTKDNAAFNLTTGAVVFSGSSVTASGCVAGASGSYTCSMSGVVLASPPARRADIGTTTSTTGGIGGTAADYIDIHSIQLNLGSTALPYQKTTDSREWALETVGNYTGLLTWWGRWDRVLSPGEVLTNYRTWIKPRVNAAGNTLP